MGIDTLPSRADATTIVATWFNVLRSALNGDLVPRASTGVATANAGSLGTVTYPFLRAEIASGQWILGDIKAHHTYNGAAPIGHGWMLCDGRVITEANYNTEHGANTWATYIVSTALLNKYLPGLTNKYLVGAATTTQDGSGVITGVGNSSHQINIAHTHTGGAHVHNWYYPQAGAGIGDLTYDGNGATKVVDYHTNTVGTGYGIAVVDVSTSAALLGVVGGSPVPNYTDSRSPVTDSQLSATQSIQPQSIEVQYYMRII